MSNNEYFEHNEYLDNDDDVIAFLGNSPNSMCKVDYFKQTILKFLFGEFPNQLVNFILQGSDIRNVKIIDIDTEKNKILNNSKWLTEGKECEILKVGSNGWKKGKVRLKITLEFIPDEPEITPIESPLDEFRQTMNQSN